MGASNCVVCGVIRHGTPPHMNEHGLPNQGQWRKYRVVKSLPGNHCMFCQWKAAVRGSWSATWKHEMWIHAAQVEAISMHDPKWEAQWQEIQTARNGTTGKILKRLSSNMKKEYTSSKEAFMKQQWAPKPASKVPEEETPTEAIPEPVTVEPKSAGGMLAGLIEDISLVLNEVEYYKARCTDLEVQARKATEREVKVAKEIQGLFDRLRG